MKIKKRVLSALSFTALVVGMFFLVIPTANAYIDPGSGSFIFQMLVGAALGASLGLKVFWRRIRAFFSRREPSEGEWSKTE